MCMGGGGGGVGGRVSLQSWVEVLACSILLFYLVRDFVTLTA